MWAQMAPWNLYKDTKNQLKLFNDDDLVKWLKFQNNLNVFQNLKTDLQFGLLSSQMQSDFETII